MSADNPQLDKDPHKNHTPVFYTAMDLIAEIEKISEEELPQENMRQIYHQIVRISEEILKFTYPADTSGIFGKKRAAKRLGERFLGKEPNTSRFSTLQKSITRSFKLTGGNSVIADLVHTPTLTRSSESGSLTVIIDGNGNSQILNICSTRAIDNTQGTVALNYTHILNGKTEIDTALNFALPTKNIPVEVDKI